MEEFVVGDKIKFYDKTGYVSRISVLGFKPCCAIEVTWDDPTRIKQILHMKEIQHVIKV